MYLGIDIGGTTIKGAIMDANNSLFHHKSVPTKSDSSPTEILENIIEFIASYTHEHEIKSIGIGIPGVVNSEGTVLIAPNLKDFVNIPVKKILEEWFSLPLNLDNDANVAAYAELYNGAGKNLKNFIYVTLGTGVGGAIIYNSQIFKGNSGSAGEIGHTFFNNLHIENIDELYNFRKFTLESFTGRNAILELYHRLNSDSPNDQIDVSDVYDMAKNGVLNSLKCFELIGTYLGVGLASAMNLLDMPNIVIGGGVSMTSDILFPHIEKILKSRLLPSLATSFQIKNAKYTKNTGIYGAAMLGKSIL